MKNEIRTIKGAPPKVARGSYTRYAKYAEYRDALVEPDMSVFVPFKMVRQYDDRGSNDLRGYFGKLTMTTKNRYGVVQSFDDRGRQDGYWVWRKK